MRLLKSIPANATAYGGFRWPTEVGEIVHTPDWDPAPRCGGGLHGLPYGVGDYSLLCHDSDAIWFDLEVVGEYTVFDDKAKAESVRILACGSRAEIAERFRADAIAKEKGYYYARSVDQCARDDTRANAIAQERGYSYACNVDKCAHDDTRADAIAKGYGYNYARDIDRSPREDTRAAAIAEGYGYSYACYVDKCVRGDTRTAAIAEGRGYEYARKFDQSCGVMPPETNLTKGETMIDSITETLVSLAEAANSLPIRRRGKRPHVTCLYRWTTVGCKGIVLESIQVGGTRCTSKEALARFFEALTYPQEPK